MYALCHGGGPCERVTYHPERAPKRVCASSMLMLGMAHELGRRTDGLGGIGAI